MDLTMFCYTYDTIDGEWFPVFVDCMGTFWTYEPDRPERRGSLCPAIPY